MNDDDQLYVPEDFGGEAPPEPAEPKVEYGDAADLYDDDTQAFIFLLGAMVHRAGGVATFTREEREVYYRLGIDQRELRPGGTGVLRLFSMLEGDA